MGTHLIDGEFQSDKYPTTPRGKVPLSVKDVTAQDLLWAYAQRRRSVDAEFANDLETALDRAGYKSGPSIAGVVMIETDHATHLIPRSEIRRVSVQRVITTGWVLTCVLANGVPFDIQFSDVEVDGYNGTAAAAVMRILTRGTVDARVVVRVDGSWEVKSIDRR